MLHALLFAVALPARVEITVAHSGLGSFKKETYSVDGSKPGVAALVAAVEAPIVPKATLANLGMTPQWLAANGEPSLHDYYERYGGPQQLTPKQRALYIESFADPSVATEWVNDTNSGQFIRTDDYPSVDVRIGFADGTSLRVSSTSQSVYMIPWKIDDRKIETFNADIARAIAALIPHGAPNYGRLSGETLSEEYADALLTSRLRDKLDTMAAQERLSSQLAPLEARFTISRMSQSTIVSDDLDGSRSLQLYLRSSTLPKSAEVYMTLLLPQCRIEGLNGAIAAADRYTALAMSAPWVRDLLAKDPKYSAQFRVVGDRSISPQLAQDLMDDLRAHGKPGIAAEVERQLPNIAYFYLNTSAGESTAYARWFVFPDRTSLLWNYKFATAFEDQIEGLPTWDWYAHVGVGALFSPEGRLLRKESLPVPGPSPAAIEPQIHLPRESPCGS